MVLENMQPERNDLFRLNPKGNTLDTGHLTMIEWPPRRLTILFGRPTKDDGYKVSGQYIFENDKGEIFVIHDWKTTTLYWGPGDGVPTLKKFWQGQSPERLSVAGREGSDPRPFLAWLREKWDQYETSHDSAIEHPNKRVNSQDP